MPADPLPTMATFFLVTELIERLMDEMIDRTMQGKNE